MATEQSDESVLEQILEARKLTREELGGVVKAARAAGGRFGGVSWEEGDGICPEWVFPFPKPGGPSLAELLAAVWRAKGAVKVFPKGIPAPDALRIVVSGLDRRT